jgi:hypothetical protein
MMSTFTKIYLVLLLQIFCIVPAIPMQSGPIPEGIILAFRAGNAEELAKYFYNNIELIILDKEDVYSKNQAEQILRKFFTDHHPASFNIIHEGGKETSRYAIGSLSTSSGNFRVSFLIKNQDGTPLIHQLRIEEEDEDNL